MILCNGFISSGHNVSYLGAKSQDFSFISKFPFSRRKLTSILLCNFSARKMLSGKIMQTLLWVRFTSCVVLELILFIDEGFSTNFPSGSN